MAYVRPIPVRFADLDALDHVNHATVLTYAETVRCDWFQEERGVTSMAALPFILASAHVDYRAPIPKTARAEVAMWVPRIGTKSWTFAYQVRDVDRTVYADVETVQVAYDYGRGRSMPVPPELRAALEALEGPGHGA